MPDRLCVKHNFLIQNTGMDTVMVTFVRKWRCSFQFSKTQVPSNNTNVMAVSYFSPGKNRKSKRALHQLWKSGWQHHRETSKIYLSVCFNRIHLLFASNMKKNRWNLIWNQDASYLLGWLMAHCACSSVYKEGWTSFLSKPQWKHAVQPEIMSDRRHGTNKHCANSPQTKPNQFY